MKRSAIISMCVAALALSAACGDDDKDPANTGNNGVNNGVNNGNNGNNGANNGVNNGNNGVNNGVNNGNNGNNGVNNGNNGEDLCLAACTRVAMCEELIDMCGADVAAAFEEGCRTQACADPDARAQIEAVGNLPCSVVVPLAIDGFGLADQCGGGEVTLDCGDGYVFTPAAAETVTFNMTLQFFATRGPVAGATIKACRRSDVQCVDPLAETTSAEDGTYEITVPTGSYGWEGYFEFTGDSIQPALGFLDQPATTDSDGFALVASPRTLAAFAGAFGAQLDAGRGHIAATVNDCEGAAVAGAAFEINAADDATILGYTAGGAPNGDATVTDAAGLGVAFNVPVGQTGVQATIPADQVVVGSHSVFTRPGFLSLIVIRPDLSLPPRLDCGLGQDNTPAFESAEFSTTFFDYLTGERLEGVTASSCEAADTMCENPVDTATADAWGRATLTLPSGGFITVTGDTIVSTNIFPTPSQRDLDAPGFQSLFTTGTAAALVGAAGVELQEGDGHIAIGVTDCAGRNLPGAVIACDGLDDGSSTVYIAGGSPTLDASMTDGSGAAGFVNVPPGPVAVSGTLGEETIQSRSVFVRAGWWSLVGVTAAR